MKKSEEVKSYIMDLINTGKLSNGERLPSCRILSNKLGVNKITVNRAYRELEDDHKVYAINRGGYYLSDLDIAMKKNTEITDFSMLKTEQKLLPYREFTHVVNKAVDIYKSDAYGYEAPEGLYSLRKLLSERFMNDGVYTTYANVMITNGAQQAITIALQVIFKDRQGKLLVESPSYYLALKQAKLMGLEMLEIERTCDGYDFHKIEELFRNGDIRAFYIIPRHHNPTGFNLSENDKKHLARLISEYNIILVEDDYLLDLGSRKGSMPVHYYANKEQVIYIRSFSKTFMPGLRLGAGIFPKSMIISAIEIKRMGDLNTTKLTQAALELFIKSGMYDKHIHKVRKIYSDRMKKADAIYQSLKYDDMEWYIPQNGIFIWAVHRNVIDLNRAQEHLLARGIKIKSAEEFFLNYRSVDFQNTVYFRLCLSGISDKETGKLSEIISVLRTVSLK